MGKKRNNKEKEEIEMDSNEIFIADSELAEEDYEEELDADASDEFKALFDSKDEDDEDSYGDEISEDDFDELMANAEEDEEDEDSLSLEESELSDEEIALAAAEMIDEEESEEDEDSFEMLDDSKAPQSLAEKFEAMSEESEKLNFTENETDLEATKSETDDSELESFESVEIEEKEFIDADTMVSIIESLLFATDKPISFSMIKSLFEGTTVKTEQIKRGIEQLQITYADPQRGVMLEEVANGYQLRTKMDNIPYLQRMNKGRPFKLSGPALETLSIVAYKQPCIKAQVDEIRGVESGHLMRALLDKGILKFAGKSDLPGKPMYYETTRKFLEIFGLRSIKELPTLTEIDELIPEGIGEEEEKATLSDVTSDMSLDGVTSYSESEEELMKIAGTLEKIDTTTEFFEQEKARQKAKEEKDRADSLREALEFGEEVNDKDIKWLARYDIKMEELRLAEEAAKEAQERQVTEENERLDESSEVFTDENEELRASSVDESAELFSEVKEEDLQDATVEPRKADVTETDESSELFADEEQTDEELLLNAESDEMLVNTDGDLELEDESAELFASDEESQLVENNDFVDESAELFAEQGKDLAAALEAFAGDEGHEVDAMPEASESNKEGDLSTKNVEKPEIEA